MEGHTHTPPDLANQPKKKLQCIVHTSAERLAIKRHLDPPFHVGAVRFVSPTIRLEKCSFNRVGIDVGGHCKRIISLYTPSKDVFDAARLRGIGYLRVCAVEGGVEKLSKGSKMASWE